MTGPDDLTGLRERAAGESHLLESIFNDIDVTQHGGVGMQCIAAQDGLNDLIMFRVRCNDTAGRTKLRAPKRLQPTPQPSCKIRQHLVV